MIVSIYVEKEEAENPVILKKLVQLKQYIRPDNEWAYEEYLKRITNEGKFNSKTKENSRGLR